MEGDTHQPPKIDEIAATIKNAKYFSILDIKNAFLNLKLKKKFF